jgi:hypothetical protein
MKTIRKKKHTHTTREGKKNRNSTTITVIALLQNCVQHTHHTTARRLAAREYCAQHPTDN